MNWIITSSALIIVVLCLRFALRGKVSARMQYAIWLVVLVRLLMPFELGETQLSLINAADRIPVIQEIESLDKVDEIYYREDGTVGGWNVWTEVGGTIAENKTEKEFQRMEVFLELKDYVVPAYRWGIFLFLIVFVSANSRFDMKLAKNREKLEINGCKLPVYVTENVDTPCLFGLFSPAIYVTPEAAADETVLRHVIEHEMTHYLHKDHIWAFLRCIAVSIHWFNPLVWLAAGISKVDAEMACDYATVTRLGEKERYAYGKTLIDMTRQGKMSLLNTATTMTGSKKTLKERVELIARNNKTAAWAAAVMVIIAVIAVICTFTGADGKASSGYSENDPLPEHIWVDGSEIMRADVDGDGQEEIISVHAEDRFLYKLQVREPDGVIIWEWEAGTPHVGWNTLMLYSADGEEMLAEYTPAVFTGIAAYKISLFRIKDGEKEIVYEDEVIFPADQPAKEEKVLPFIEKANDILAGCTVLLSTHNGGEVIGPADTDRFIQENEMLLMQINNPDWVSVEFLLDDINSIPGPVLNYAAEYVQNRAKDLAEREVEVTLASITALEIINTGTAGLDSGAELYRLEYQFMPENPQSEEAAQEQPYLLLSYEESQGKITWKPVCVTSESVIQNEYASAQMIEEYGNEYTAATMELWKKNRS